MPFWKQLGQNSQNTQLNTTIGTSNGLYPNKILIACGGNRPPCEALKSDEIEYWKWPKEDPEPFSGCKKFIYISPCNGELTFFYAHYGIKQEGRTVEARFEPHERYFDMHHLAEDGRDWRFQEPMKGTDGIFMVTAVLTFGFLGFVSNQK